MQLIQAWQSPPLVSIPIRNISVSSYSLILSIPHQKSVLKDFISCFILSQTGENEQFYILPQFFSNFPIGNFLSIVLK